MKTYQRFPISIVKGKGCWVWDENGRKYLDAVAGIATCSLGHSNKALSRALSAQLKTIQHVSNLYKIREQEELSTWLVKNSCADSVFFCNSGAEANEAAIKLARKYAHEAKKIEDPVILTAKESFHGRTLAAVSATGQPKYHKGFEPLVKGFEFFTYNSIESFNNLFKEVESNGSKVSAVLIEPLQGEGGVNLGSKEFFRELRRICLINDTMLIFDEVQTGMGRTGSLWCYEQLGIEPDAFTLAKGLGGGHAIGALLVKNKFDIFQPGDHASTFGGNPFACKAGLTVANEIERLDLLFNIKERGIQLKEGLLKIVNRFPNLLLESRGMGLIQGLVLREDVNINAQIISEMALKENLLIVTAGKKVLRMVPPLIIKSKEIKILLDRLNLTLMRLS